MSEREKGVDSEVRGYFIVAFNSHTFVMSLYYQDSVGYDTTLSRKCVYGFEGSRCMVVSSFLLETTPSCHSIAELAARKST